MAYASERPADGEHARSTLLEERESTRGLHATIELAPIGIAHFDLDGRFLLANERLCAILGYAHDDLLTRTFQELAHPEDLGDWLRLHDELVAGITSRYEQAKRFIRGDGAVIWVQVTVAAVRDAEDRIAFFVGVADDVTERRAQERALRESESKLRRIVESGVVGVFYWTLGRAISDANDEFLRMLGYTRDELDAGRLHADGLTPPGWEAIDDRMIDELRRTGRASWEKEFYARDGRRVPVFLAKALLDGTTDRAIAICLDISERKRAEEERERLLEREREARAQAERATWLRDEMLALVAHDLRNPVNTITMTAGLLRDASLAAESRVHHAEVIERSAIGMAHMISDLLEVSTIESGSFTIKRGPVRLHALLGQTADDFQAQADAAGVLLTCDTGPDLPPVVGDADGLMRVLSNLVSNALKFSPRSGSVLLRARQETGAVHVCVEDTGPGIPQDVLPHVFDRFWHAQHDARAGSGLGLHICKGIVEAHGGRIWVESEPGVGTAFHFALPV